MPALLISIVTWLCGSLVSRLLIGAGLGLGVSAFMINFLNYYINGATQQLSGGSATVLAFIGLSGVDKGLSIILGALVTRVTLSSMKIGLIKK